MLKGEFRAGHAADIGVDAILLALVDLELYLGAAAGLQDAVGARAYGAVEGDPLGVGIPF